MTWARTSTTACPAEEEEEEIKGARLLGGGPLLLPLPTERSRVTLLRTAEAPEFGRAATVAWKPGAGAGPAAPAWGKSREQARRGEENKEEEEEEGWKTHRVVGMVVQVKTAVTQRR